MVTYKGGESDRKTESPAERKKRNLQKGRETSRREERLVEKQRDFKEEKRLQEILEKRNRDLQKGSETGRKED